MSDTLELSPAETALTFALLKHVWEDNQEGFKILLAGMDVDQRERALANMQQFHKFLTVYFEEEKK